MHTNINIYFKHNHVCLLCFTSLIKKRFFCFFLLSIFTFRSLKLHAVLRFYSGIICGPIWGSFVVLGSFAVQSGDHLRSGIICGFGIICGAVQACKQTSQIYFCKVRVKFFYYPFKSRVAILSRFKLASQHTSRSAVFFLRIQFLQSARNNFWRFSSGGQVMLRARLNRFKTAWFA